MTSKSAYTCIAPDCWLMPECPQCGKVKRPRGRSAPLETAGTWCEDGCPGYYLEPRSGHLWPGELGMEGKK